MTYKQLSESISKMTEEQQNCDVTVFVRGVDEFYPTSHELFINKESDVLDEGHPYLQV